MTTSTSSSRPAPAAPQAKRARSSAYASGARDYGLDALRGLAILLMIGDHVALFLDFGPYRFTLGRVAMPLFFVLAGHLIRPGFRPRLVMVLGLGLALPVVVPWVDSPNVLFWIGTFGLFLGFLQARRVPLWPFALLGFLVAANRWEAATGGYEPFALLGLMVLGSLLPRSAFAFGALLPGWVAVMGRAPLRWYVGHVLLLQAVVLVAWAWW